MTSSVRGQGHHTQGDPGEGKHSQGTKGNFSAPAWLWASLEGRREEGEEGGSEEGGMGAEG
jgi:hypothetical protein